MIYWCCPSISRIIIITKTKDKQIIDTAIQGTNNIIKFSPEYCKIIFPSTHVVYEGFPDTVYNLTEEVPTTPILTYSTSKVQNEKDIRESGKNYFRKIMQMYKKSW